MERKQKNIIIVVVGLLLVSVVLWFIMTADQKPVDDNQNGEQQQEVEKSSEELFAESVVNITPSLSAEQMPISVSSRRFSERLGSHSDSRDVNLLVDFIPLTTSRGLLAVKNYYNQIKSQNSQSTSANIISIEVISTMTDKAQVKVDLLIKSNEMDIPKSLVLDLILVNNEWLVDGFNWL